MSEHREEFLLEIEAKLFGLTVKELHRVCEYCKIAGKDSEDIKNKTRRALVKHIVKFCEREEFLEREDEGMSVLLELNDTLEALREHPAETDDAGAAPLFSSPAAEEAEEETVRSAQPVSGRQHGDCTRVLPPPATPVTREVTQDEGAQNRGRNSISNNCWPSNGFRKDFRINGHVAKLNATGHRWVSELADFNITLKYRPGKINTDADFLSCTPVSMDSYMSECTEQCSPEVLSAIFGSVETQKQHEMDWISAITCSPHVQDFAADNQPDIKVTQQELLQAQSQDPVISHVLQLKASGVKPDRRIMGMETNKTKQLLHEWKRLYVSEEGLLKRKTATCTQIVLPEKYKAVVYKYLHCEMGHLGG
ncbi:uncharacterized protein LOC127143390 [Lates calcarifer]|uniref:Uncharacterized protein LOC127143390 n=1 Tax=Lates calcarifer TaxID=8187 RepID=A0AAJ8BG58_LATCA|nr:uncharacterized protein LOC127143390 [Lates calcarifer]